eukprot:UN32573
MTDKKETSIENCREFTNSFGFWNTRIPRRGQNDKNRILLKVKSESGKIEDYLMCRMPEWEPATSNRKIIADFRTNHALPADTPKDQKAKAEVFLQSLT